MNKKSIITDLVATNYQIQNLRTKLLRIISELLKGKRKIEFPDDTDQALIYHDGTSISISGVSKESVSGCNNVGVTYEIDLGELSTDDLQAVAERRFSYLANMKSATQDLRKTAKIDKTQSLVYQIMETILAIIAVAMTKDCITSTPTWDTKFIIMVIGLDAGWLTMFIVRLWKTKSTPSVLADYVQTVDEGKNLQHELDRKKTIDEFVDKSIKALNENTCNWEGVESHVCENPIMDGYKKVWECLIDSPQHLFNTSKIKFTIAAYIERSPFKTGHGLGDDKVEPVHVDFKDEVFTLRDDYYLIEDIKQCQLHTKERSKDHYLQIYQQGIISFNNTKLISTILELLDGKKVQLITVPIPAVCEAQNNGVLFVVTDVSVVLPSDIENVLLIFNRLSANWESKFLDCLNRKVQSELDSAKGITKAGYAEVFMPEEIRGLKNQTKGPSVDNDGKVAS